MKTFYRILNSYFILKRGTSMQYILYIVITTTLIYSQDCNQNNWQQYNPNLEYCDLAGVNIAWADMSGFNFFGIISLL